MKKNVQIRNSTVDFLIFTKDSKSDGIEVRVQDGDVWLTQNAIAQLFDIDRSVVSKHLKKIFSSGELDENSVCAKYAQTADDGKNYNYKFYSLAAIIREWLYGKLESGTYKITKTVLDSGASSEGDSLNRYTVSAQFLIAG